MPSKPRTLAGILHRRRAGDAEYNRARRSGPDRGVEDVVVSSGRWKALRARVLRDEPLCRACAAAGRTELATQVDHVVPVRVRPDLAFDRGNTQPLCGPCHGLKTASERRLKGGVGGTSSSYAAGGYGGARGTSQFSRVSPLSDAPPSEGQKWPVAGDSCPHATPGATAAPEPPLAPAGGLNPALAGDGGAQDGAGACDAKPGVSGGVAPPGRDLGPRDIEAMAVGLALTHGLPVADARARIEAALARGDRVLEVP